MWQAVLTFPSFDSLTTSQQRVSVQQQQQPRMHSLPASMVHSLAPSQARLQGAGM